MPQDHEPRCDLSIQGSIDNFEQHHDVHGLTWSPLTLERVQRLAARRSPEGTYLDSRLNDGSHGFIPFSELGGPFMTDCSSCARARRGVEEDVGQRHVLCIARGRIHQLKGAHGPRRPILRTPTCARHTYRSASVLGEQHCGGSGTSPRVRRHTVATSL